MVVMKLCTAVVLTFGLVMALVALCMALELLLVIWSKTLNHLTANLKATSLIFRYVMHRKRIDKALREIPWERGDLK